MNGFLEVLTEVTSIAMFLIGDGIVFRMFCVLAKKYSNFQRRARRPHEEDILKKTKIKCGTIVPHALWSPTPHRVSRKISHGCCS